MSAAIAGFTLGLSLILAIGAQNAFVLRQGLRRSHVFAVCAVCAASDLILIAAGVGGLGAATKAVPWLEPAMRWAGAAALAVYAVRHLRDAVRGGAALEAAQEGGESLRRALLTCLALTWLNPHVYLDTMLLVGSVSTRWPGAEWAFGAGAGSASVLFFFALGYGARLLAPLFARPAAWRLLDLLVAVTMAALAILLIVG